MDNCNTNWIMHDDKFSEVFEHEWYKLTKKLRSNTPSGTIRFALLDYRKLKLKLHLKFFSNPTILNSYTPLIENAFCDNPNPCVCRYFEHFPPYHKNYEKARKAFSRSLFCYDTILVFYGNNIQSNPECAEELITHWFEKYVIPDFKKSIRSSASKKKQKFYSYMPIERTLRELNQNIPVNEYKRIFTKLSKEHGFKLISFTERDFKLKN